MTKSYPHSRIKCAFFYPIDSQPVKTNERLAANAVLKNISDRKGLDLDSIDSDILEEMVDTVSVIIEESMAESIKDLQSG